MKVLQINSVCGIRSTGRICTDIADVLKSEGNECIIAYGREPAPEKYNQDSVRTDSEIGVKIHAVESRIFDNSGFARKKASEKFIERVKEYDPDIIHLHNIHGYYINAEVLFEYLKKAGKPVIWTLHDCWAFTGHCTHFERAGCDKWKTGCGKCPQKRKYPASYVFDASARNSALKKRIFSGVPDTVLVTPSQWLADYVQESFLSSYPVKVIHNGIDIDTFKYTDSGFREKYHIKDKKILLGVSSSWGKSKGFYDFLRLQEKLNENYQIVLVGLNDRQYKELPQGIIGIKRTDSVTELAGIYSAADVFVNPTYADNYPTVNLEAQACGTPAITYKTGGSVESVPENQIIKQGDIDGLADKIRDICENGNFKITDRNSFDKRITFKKYCELYKSMI